MGEGENEDLFRKTRVLYEAYGGYPVRIEGIFLRDDAGRIVFNATKGMLRG